MTIETEGIVLSQVRYGDNSVVVKIFTREEGLQGFMVKGVGKKGGRFRNAYFFPLSQVEVVYSRTKPVAGLSFLKEIRSSYVYRNLYDDIRKSTVAMFLAEVMAKTITQSEQDHVFYDKISRALRLFDSNLGPMSDFHLYFLLEMSLFLGICPRLSQHPSDVYFDLNEGCFTSCIPPHSEYMSLRTTSDLKKLMDAYLNSGSDFPLDDVLLSGEARSSLLKSLVRYLSIQTGVQGNFQSLDILHEVFS